MTITKGLGFLLLALGIGIILYSLFASYLIFTGSNQAPELFLMQEKAKDSLPIGSLEDLQRQLPDLLGQGFLPADTLSDMLNLGAWSILAGIFIFGGAQLAGIGVRLVK